MIARKDITSSLLLLLCGAGYLAYNTRYSMDTWNNPGPAVFPLIVGGIFMILAACRLIQTLRKLEKQDDQEGVKLSRKSITAYLQESGEAKPLILIAVFILYLLMVTGVGFFTSNLLFVMVSSRLMGARDWGKPLALGVGICLFCYLLFEVWLKLSLPRGLLF